MTSIDKQYRKTEGLISIDAIQRILEYYKEITIIT